jgi:TetR/AcrR family transcriptional regulator
VSFTKSFEHDEALLAAALAEFTANGYEQASINKILQTAGMSKGQFYYHFENKEALYLALIEILIARKREFMAAVMQPEDFQQDLFGIFKTQVRYGLAFAQAYPAINRFAESFAREQGNAIYDKVLAVYNFMGEGPIASLVEAASTRDELRPDLPLPFMKKIIGFLFTHAVEAADLNDSISYEQNLNYLIEFMRAGAAKRNNER